MKLKGKENIIKYSGSIKCFGCSLLVSFGAICYKQNGGMGKT